VANSIEFNSTDLSDYGLIVNGSNIPDFNQVYDSVLIKDLSYAFTPKRPPKIISLNVSVIATTRAILDGYLDNIKLATVFEVAKVLKLDAITDRYWNAKNTAFEGRYMAPGWFEGIMIFQADDPMAYDNSAVSNTYNIDADPDTNVETPGGNGYIFPVYTLTAGELLTTVTIKVENTTTDEELQFIGTVASGKALVINTATWVVTNDGTEDMADVTGKFPRLKPGVANSIKVTAFSTTGTLNVAYRNRYL